MEGSLVALKWLVDGGAIGKNWDKRENRGLQRMNAKGAGNLRDPEDRIIDHFCSQERKEKMMDKTIADSFPASDPSSSLPDPDEDSFGSPCSQGKFKLIN